MAHRSIGSQEPIGSPPTARFVVVAGNIGSGKTTLATILADRMGLALRLESVDDNPYLERFYVDMARWVFHLNMYFLGTRSQQILQAAAGAPSICDRSLYEDRLFVDLALADGVATAEGYATFRRLYDVLEEALPPPALLIYLSAPTDVLATRITKRGRAYERTIPAEYLQRLQVSYDNWINTYASSPVLRVDSAATNWGVDDVAVSRIETAVNAALGAG